MNAEESRKLAEDWSPIMWPVSQTVYYACGVRYRSHAKIVKADRWRSLSKDPCPGCGHHANTVAVRGDPEHMTLSGSD